MFTGLVEELGRVRETGADGEGFRMRITAERVVEDAAPGDSIAVNGVCLTVTELFPDGFSVGLAPETRSRTNLDRLSAGDPVQLERAMPAHGRFGGHYLQGHVDGMGEVRAFRPDADALWLTVGVSRELARYLVPKGYVAIDGASLTVVNVGDDWFDVTLIAYSQEKLALPGKRVGDAVNIEVDIIAKYVERLASAGALDRRPPAIKGAGA